MYCSLNSWPLLPACGPGSSVGIATRYGLDGPGIESRWGRDFPYLFRPALGPTQPPVQWIQGLSRCKERPGRDADPSPPSSAVVKKRVAPYLYSPCGLYGLYRASVPVQRCTLPLCYMSSAFLHILTYVAFIMFSSPVSRSRISENVVLKFSKKVKCVLYLFGKFEDNIF